jgi:hypothetical protein
MKRLPGIFGAIVILLLLLPAVQKLTGIVYVRPLNGVTLQDTTQLSWSWWNRDLQRRLEKQATDSFSLQPACVRLRNQFEFTFFDKLNAQDIYESNGVFFRYTFANYNEDDAFIGETRINRAVAALARFQDSVRQDVIPVYVVIAPSKLHYYRAQLPWVNRTKTERTNYLYYKRALEKAGIRVLDTDAWFLRDKPRHTVSVLSKGGAHWTLYGGALAFDSLIRRISADKRTDFQQVNMEISQENRIYPEDMDIAGLCNLISEPTDPSLRLAHFPPAKQPKRRLRPVVISDSFFHVISWTPLHPQVLDPETPFYYYYHTRFTQSGANRSFTRQQVLDDISKADCIIILTDIQNMERFGFGFIEDMGGY